MRSVLAHLHIGLRLCARTLENALCPYAVDIDFMYYYIYILQHMFSTQQH